MAKKIGFVDCASVHPKQQHGANLIFSLFATFVVLTIFASGLKQKFLFTGSMLDHNAIIDFLDFLDGAGR